MKTQFALVAFAALVAVAAASPTHLFADEPLSFEGTHFTEHQARGLFKAWKIQHGKNYASVEEHYKRFGIFWSNLEKIYKHNSDKTQTFTKGMNKFGDLTAAEFKATYANLDMSKRPISFKPMDVSKVSVADSLDWRTKGAVTAIKDQGVSMMTYASVRM